MAFPGKSMETANMAHDILQNVCRLDVGGANKING